MKKITTTVTVGIPAFNEEANIAFLIQDILNQNQRGFVLERIIVSSDASTDNTVKLAKSINSPLIKVFDNRVNKGQAYRQNQIIDLTSSDVLVILNADIVITDRNFIGKLIKPIIKSSIDLTSAQILEITPKTMLEKAAKISMDLKRSMFDEFQGGDNLYTCHGPARAFSKKLYLNFRFTHSVGEDAYSYLFSKYYDYRYKFVKEAVAYYKLSDNFSDHRKQSQRFEKSKRIFKEEFGERFVVQAYDLPLSLVVMQLLKFALKNPFFVLYYLTTMIFIKFSSNSKNEQNEIWQVATSSKRLRS